MSKLAYMADIFSLLNDLNLSLQGFCTNIFKLRNKVDAFKKKLVLWDCRVQVEDLEMFPLLQEFLIAADVDRKGVLNVISQHLKVFVLKFNHYYLENEDPRKGNLWINNPFMEDIISCTLTSREKEQLIELSSDVTLISRHKTLTLPQFWISVEDEYPSLSCKAINLLMSFSTTYSCEKAFSSMSSIKSKQRNRLDLNAALCLSETVLQLRLSNILAKMQQQVSH